MLYKDPIKLEDQIKILADGKKINYIFVIEMDNTCNYIGLKVDENSGNEEKYLFKISKDGNKNGTFMTGEIKEYRINELKNVIKGNENDPENLEYYKFKTDFKRKQILWIEHQGILTDNSTLSKIPIESQKLLKAMVNEVNKKQDQILQDISQKVLEGNYKNILLTYKIGNRYLSEIEGFPLLFKITSFMKEVKSSTTNANCIICNNKAFRGKLREILPFYSIDQLNFIPDGIKKNSAKSFPLCEICALKIISGYKYIEKYLKFRIPDTYKNTELYFWIIPQLKDIIYVKEHLEEFNKNISSFRSLFDISQSMTMVSEFDLKYDLDMHVEQQHFTYNFLSYIALFFTYDYNKRIRIMRLIESVDGIYPPRFKELSDIKYKVDKIAIRNGNSNRFYFGLLVDFLEYFSRKNFEKTRENKKRGWIKVMSHIMNCIFTKKKIEESFIAKILLFCIKSSFFDEKIQNIEQIQQIILKATLILEYLYRINTLEHSIASKYLSINISENKYSDMSSSNSLIDENIKSAKKFLFYKDILR